jgi:hypothetical protein
VEVSGASEGLAWVGGGGLPDVVYEADGEVELALEAAEEAEEVADVCGGVLVSAVEADEGVEDEESGPYAVEGDAQAALVVEGVEAEADLGDEAEGEPVEVGASGGGDVADALSDVGGAVLGGEEKDGAGLLDAEAAEAGPARCDGDGEVEGEPGLARLGGAAHDADGVVGPEAGGEPAFRGKDGLDVGHADDGQRFDGGKVHGMLR